MIGGEPLRLSTGFLFVSERVLTATVRGYMIVLAQKAEKPIFIDKNVFRERSQKKHHWLLRTEGRGVTGGTY